MADAQAELVVTDGYHRFLSWRPSDEERPEPSPEHHICTACGRDCSCGATLLDGLHYGVHPTFRHLSEDERRLHIRPPCKGCVHKCPDGRGENWVESPAIARGYGR